MGTGRRGKLPTTNYAAVKRAPAFERHIIDMSEWTCVNYRYVTGYHFGILTSTSERGEVANISPPYAKIPDRVYRIGIRRCR